MLDRTGSKRGQREWLIAVSFTGIIVRMGPLDAAGRESPLRDGRMTRGLLIAGEKWDVGQELPREASPASFQKMVTLYNTWDQQTLEFCTKTIAAQTNTDTPANLSG